MTARARLFRCRTPAHAAPRTRLRSTGGSGCDVATQRHVRDVRRAVGVAAGLDVDVRLEEHQTEKRPTRAFGGTTIGGLAIERADGRVEIRAHLLIHVQPEVLPVVAAQTE